MFSVIIPLYNKAAYIEKAIRSVLAQTYQEFELIVVNDGSTDDSLEIVRNCQSSIANCQLLEQQNQGVSVARNNGVKLAKYDYIAFLDADDWWELTYLEEMKKLTEEFPDGGIYSCSYYKVKNKKNSRADIGVAPDFTKGRINYFRIYANNIFNMPLWTGATVVRRNIFENENGFKPGLKLGEDFDLWVRIALKYPVVFLNKPLAYYNQDVEQINRAIGNKLYKPDQHMLFTNYGDLQKNKDFNYLYQKLAVYGLFPYFLSGINSNEVKDILSNVNWGSQSLKYRLYYKILPKFLVKMSISFLSFAAILKKKLLYNK